MELPFFKKPKNNAQQREYFFALEIDHSLVKSAIWTVANDKTQVISVGSNSHWDDKSEDSLLQACDLTLSDAANRLDQTGKIQPEKVILGLPPDWMDDDKIESSKLKLLKAISQKLSLNAVGFVVTPEAAVKFLQHSEGVPPTAILLGFWPEYIETTLVRLGKIDGIHLVTRSAKVTEDVIEGLSRYHNVDMLPSRMLLYDSGLDLEEIKQQLLAHPWQAPQTRLPFLHFPKIEVLPPDFTIRAIALAGGTEVARAIGLISASPETTESPPEPTPIPIPVPTHHLPPQETSPADFGFLEDGDVQRQADSLQSSPQDEPQEVETYIPFPTHPVVSEKSSRFKKPKLSLPGLSLHKLRLPKLSLSAPLLPLFIIILLILAGSGVMAAYWYLPKATVTISVTPKSIQHQFDLTADTAVSSVDTSRALIPAKSLEVTASGEKTISTTGSKLIGDKATGTVTIINGTSNTKSFTAGTVITSPSGLKFALDSDVQVASASGTADPNSYQPGKANVKVTASQIGTESNLSAGTQFKIGSFSSLDFVARNEEALSGGSSRQVKAVAKADLDSLKSELTSTIRDQAKQDLLSQTSDGETVIEESITLQTNSETFDRKVDDVADQVTLKLAVLAKGISVNSSDLSQVVTDQIRPQVPDGYSPGASTEHQFTVKKSEKTTAVLGVGVTANLLPRLNPDDIVTQITGKNPTQAKDYLDSLPGVSRVDFVFSPRLPAQVLTLPHVPKNINLEIQADQ